MVSPTSRAQAVQVLHRLRAELTVERTLRPGPRWLTSVDHAHAFNEALLLLRGELGARYVHAQVYGTKSNSGHLKIAPVRRDQLLSKVQDALARSEAGPPAAPAHD